MGRHSRELCPAFSFSILVPREVRAGFLPCLSCKPADGPGWVWGELPGPSSESEGAGLACPRGETLKGSQLADQAEHLLGKALQGPGEGVSTTGIPEPTHSTQGKLRAEVCDIGPLLKVGTGGDGKEAPEQACGSEWPLSCQGPRWSLTALWPGGGGAGRQGAGGEGPQRPRMEGGGKYLCHLGERTRSGMELGTSDGTRAALGSGRGWRVMGGEGRGGIFSFY